MLNIQKNTGTHNTTVKTNRPLKFIVIHYTAGTSSKVGSASNTCSYFKSLSAGGSADFCVDDGSIFQYNPDIKNRYCWAVGGSKYGSMTTSLGGKYYSIANNTNCISIEMCSNKTNKSRLGSNDDDWYLTEATINNAVELTKYLIKTYNIPESNVIMHHQITGKCCPNPWVLNESRLSGWYDFKKRIMGNSTDIVDTTAKVSINGKIDTYKSKNVNGNNYIEGRKFLEKLGYSVGFNNIKKRVMADALTLDVPTIIENGTSYIHIRDTIAFLNKYDTVRFPTDKTITYNSGTKVIVIS